MPAIIVLAILFAGSCIFGGYELWINLRQKDEIKNLQAEKTNQGEIVVSDDENKTNYSQNIEESSDYISIEKWKIKIKKPKDVVGFSYLFDGHRLYMWGTIYRQGDQSVGSGVAEERDGRIDTPFLAKIYTDTLTAKNLDTGEVVGDKNKLCELENATYITDIDLETYNSSYSYYHALCYKETDNLSDYYQETGVYIAPTLDKLRSNFLNTDNYIKL